MVPREDALLPHPDALKHSELLQLHVGILGRCAECTMTECDCEARYLCVHSTCARSAARTSILFGSRSPTHYTGEPNLLTLGEYLADEATKALHKKSSGIFDTITFKERTATARTSPVTRCPSQGDRTNPNARR